MADTPIFFYMLVFCTCENQPQGMQIGEALVRERLAACVNILPPIQSIYRWEGNIETAEEVLLLIKTTRDRFPALRDRIQQLHSYDTPEIIAIPITDGSEKYLAWLGAQV